MTSGDVLKSRNGEGFVIRKRYETALPCSSQFLLTVPAAGLLNHSIIARELNLASKQQISTKITASPQDTRNITNLLHPDDPDPYADNRMLFSQSQIDGGMPYQAPKA